jgi:hypothetical protein
MKINLRIEYLDGNAKDVLCTAADLVKFETKFDLSVTELEKKTKFTHLLFLAWASETRTKATALVFDEWVETISSITASDSDPK